MIGIQDLIHIGKIMEIFEEYGYSEPNQYGRTYFFEPTNHSPYYLETKEEKGLLKVARMFELKSGKDSCIYEYNFRHPSRQDFESKGMEGFLNSVKDLDISFKDQIQSFFNQRNSYEAPYLQRKQY